MFWNIQLSLRRKLALAAIFSITTVIMVFAIIRVAVVSGRLKIPDESWLYFWTSVEQMICESLP